MRFLPGSGPAGLVPIAFPGAPEGDHYGDLEEDLATNTKDVVLISRFLAENNAFRLKEELKTLPRVYYIPGHGEAVGRTPYQRGLKPVTWPWGGA